MSWPLALSGGFEGSISGMDNIRFISRIYKKPLEDMIAFVDDFAELGRQLYLPVRNYSSGMRARLAFALTIAIDFECFLIDEVISVGDRRFQTKCREALFVERKHCAMILVSHDMRIIKDYCNQALILKNGRGKVFDDCRLRSWYLLNFIGSYRGRSGGAKLAAISTSGLSWRVSMRSQPCFLAVESTVCNTANPPPLRCGSGRRAAAQAQPHASAVSGAFFLVSPQQTIILRVCANPKPSVAVWLFRGQGAVSGSNANRPQDSRFLELKRRMPWVRFEKLETLVRQTLMCRRKRVVTEAGRCEVSHNSRPRPSA